MVTSLFLIILNSLYRALEKSCQTNGNSPTRISAEERKSSSPGSAAGRQRRQPRPRQPENPEARPLRPTQERTWGPRQRHRRIRRTRGRSKRRRHKSPIYRSRTSS
ncbi:hypothetical protein OIU78_028752 [Salix suchowensis]|nr:hypothetical protein OIU78_028752 [Salix suchowensis]